MKNNYFEDNLPLESKIEKSSSMIKLTTKTSVLRKDSVDNNIGIAYNQKYELKNYSKDEDLNKNEVFKDKYKDSDKYFFPFFRNNKVDYQTEDFNAKGSTTYIKKQTFLTSNPLFTNAPSDSRFNNTGDFKQNASKKNKNKKMNVIKKFLCTCFN